MCETTGKLGFTTRREALEILKQLRRGRRLRRGRGRRLSEYRCSGCGMWHLGERREHPHSTVEFRRRKEQEYLRCREA